MSETTRERLLRVKLCGRGHTIKGEHDLDAEGRCKHCVAEASDERRSLSRRSG